MEVSPKTQEFSEIFPLDQEQEEKFTKTVEEAEMNDTPLLVKGDKENLEKLQNDLRKVGYKQIFKR